MDDFTLGKKLFGKEATAEQKTASANPSSASIVEMVAVTASSGGEVVVRNADEDSDEIWETGEPGVDYIELGEDGDYDEESYDNVDDLEDVDDGALDMTDGDGADIEGSDEEAVAFTVEAYHAAAVAAAEEEAGQEDDPVPDESASVTDELEDGDAADVENPGDPSLDDAVPGEDAEVAEVSDDEYTAADDNDPDESEEPLDGAEISDGSTVVETTVSVKEGDRVLVSIQDGRMTVIGVVGGGDEAAAEQSLTQEAVEEANAAALEAAKDAADAVEAAGNAQQKAEEADAAASAAQNSANQAQESADQANQAAQAAQNSANQAAQEAQEASQKATDAQAKADQVETDMEGVTAEVNSVKEDAAAIRKEMVTSGQLETVRTELSATYATKTELGTAETTLRQETAASIAEVQNTMSQDYAKTSDVDGAIVDAKAELQTQITQNANEISSVARSVEAVQVDVTENAAKVQSAQAAAEAAQATADEAKTDAQEAADAATSAQSAANTANQAAASAQAKADEAKANAQTAQSAADDAAAELATAKAKLAEVEGNANATAADLEEARAAVETAQKAADDAAADAANAKSAADAAQSTANTAKTNAATAQSTADTAKANAAKAQTAADNAQAAADEAKEDLLALATRVTTTEAGIKNLNDSISLYAKKTEVTETLGGYYTKDEADAAIDLKADEITQSVSQTYQTKDAMSGYSTTAQMNSAINQKADSITSSVSATYATKAELNKKAGDYTVELYNGTGGNPKPVKFLSVNYSTCGSENGVAAKVGMISGHGNGTSYAFMQDVVIRVNHIGGVEVDNFKHYGADAGTYDGAARQYGDIFWVADTTNKVVDFYVLMGQYARLYQTPWKRVTYSTGGTVTQYTSCTVYSSGTKVWANNSDIALMTDVAELSTRITQTESDIALRATKTELTAVSNTASTAQSTANTAKANAATAQTTADNAAAAANDAQDAADAAQGTANTANSTANSVKNDLANNYYNKTATDAAITVEANKVRTEVSEDYQTKDGMGSYATKTLLEQTASAITGRVEGAEGNISTLQQTANGLDVRLTAAEKDVDTAQDTASHAEAAAGTAQTTANTAKTNAATAQSTADTARTEAADAAKTATNYLGFSSDGLVVGDMTKSTLGKNVLIDSDSVDIRDGSTTLATFSANRVELGKGGIGSTIDLCDGAGTITASEGQYNGGLKRLEIAGGDSVGIDGGAGIDLGVDSSGIAEAYPLAQSSMSIDAYNTFGETVEANLRIGASYAATKDAWYSAGVEAFINHTANPYLRHYVEGDSNNYMTMYDDRTVFSKRVHCEYGDTAFMHTHSTSGTKVSLGVGNGGTNHGVHSPTMGAWLIYGNGTDIYLYSPGGAFRPYYSAGNSINIGIRTAGFCTSTKSQIQFCVPLGKPIFGISSVTVSSQTNGGLRIRQGGSYTHGSSADAYAKPASYSAAYSTQGFVNVYATYNTTTNAVNNATAGVDALITLTFNA